MKRRIAILSALVLAMGGGVVANASNAFAADNTSIRLKNISALFNNVTICATTRSGSTRCLENVGPSFYATKGIHVRNREKVHIQAKSGTHGGWDLYPVWDGKFEDIFCTASRYELKCKRVHKF